MASADVLFKVVADTKKATQEIGKLDDKFKKAAFAGASVAIGAKVLGELAGAVYDVGVAAEQSFAMTSTLLTGTTEEIQTVKSEMTKLGASYGQDASKMADATYQLLSAGTAQADVIKMIDKNTRLAVGSGADLVDVIDLTTTVTNAYGLSVEETEKAMEQMLMTQNLGKTTVAELSATMGKAIPIAKANNVSFEQLSAVYATTTAQGIGTAETTTMLNAMMRELGDESSTVGKIIKDRLGVSFRDFMADGGNLGEILGVVEQHTLDTGESMDSLFASSEATTVALALTGEGANTLDDNLYALKEASGVVDDAFDTMSGTTEHLNNVIKEKFNASLIEIFDIIAVMLKPVLQWMADNMQWLAPIIIALVVAFGLLAVIIGVATIAQMGLNFAILANPITWIVLAIIVLIGVLIALIANWDSVVQFMTTTWNGFLLFFAGIGQAISDIWTLVTNWFTLKMTEAKNAINRTWASVLEFFTGIKVAIIERWKAMVMAIIIAVINLKTSVNNAWNGIKESAVNVFTSIWQFVSGIANKIANVFVGVTQGIATGLTSAFNTVVNSLKSIVNNLMVKPLNGALGLINMIPGVSIPAIPMLATGTITKGPMAAIVGEAGQEAIVPLENPTLLSKLGSIIGSYIPENTKSDVSGSVGQTVMNVVIDAKNMTTRELEKMLLDLSKGSGY